MHLKTDIGEETLPRSVATEPGSHRAGTDWVHDDMCPQDGVGRLHFKNEAALHGMIWNSLQDKLLGAKMGRFRD